MRTPYVVALDALVLTACSTVSDVQSVDALSSMQKLQAQGQFEQIANQPVGSGCAPGTEACAKIYAIHAYACLVSATGNPPLQAACPDRNGPKAKWIDCAVDDYRKAKGATKDPAELSNLAGNQAHALYCSAEFRRFDDDQQGAASLAREAEAAVSSVPYTAQNARIAASAALMTAQLTKLPSSDRCLAARNAARWATRGLALPQSDPGETDSLNFSLTEARAEAKDICGGL
jgi:hypothetical protein